MKKLRCVYLWISLILMIGVHAPAELVFAETMASVEDGISDSNLDDSNNSTESLEIDKQEKQIDDATDADDVVEPITLFDEGKQVNVIIKSYNPGFSTPYVGEYFELARLSKNFISLAGLSIIYETSSGSEYLVYEFLDGDEMVGESLLMRLASSTEVKEADDVASVADATYTRNMSQSAGRIVLKYADETIDSLCWGIKEDGCYSAFKTGKNMAATTLVRSMNDDEVGDFEFLEDYIPSFDAKNPGLKHAEIEEEVLEPKCSGLEFSEILTYYESSSTEQFIELFNRGEEELSLDGCFIRYKNSNYGLTGDVPANSYVVFYPASAWSLTLTKNPSSANTLEIIDVDSAKVDKLTYYSGQKKGVSLALVGFRSDGSEDWEQTYSPTPGADNTYQQFRTCPVGKVINLTTGNCVNDTAVEVTLAACPEGKYRNPLTGRCKSYASLSATELKPCAEGYERNPATGRCKKIVENNGASFPIAATSYEEKSEFTSIFAVATVIVMGLGYIAFQYKSEIASLFTKKKV